MELTNYQTVALYSFLLATVFGFIAAKTNFCTMGAISDWILFGDKGRLSAWLVAIAIAIIGSQFLHTQQLINLNESIYLSSNLNWLGHLLGGFMFGIGMTLAAGCGTRSLQRLGGGNLKSLVVILMMALTAMMTLSGLLAPLRINLIEATQIDLSQLAMVDQSVVSFVANILGIDSFAILRWLLTMLFVTGLLGFAMMQQEFRSRLDNILAAVVIGLLIIAAWYLTGVVGFDEFEPIRLESFSFVAPIGNTLQYLMTYTGSSINFGIAAVFGVIFGAFSYALLTGTFKIETFQSRHEMISFLVGGSLMGSGGVLALGCTIGQGITGISTLALGSVMALTAIVLGSVLTLKVQYRLLEGASPLCALAQALCSLNPFCRRR